MRVAALYDIHGNLPALEAVLAEVREAGVDHIVVGGDVVPGPMPHEAMVCLSALAVPVSFIRGNGEREVLAHFGGSGLEHLPASVRSAIQWSGDQLLPEQRDQLAAWPFSLTLSLAGLGDVLFCHATPRDDNEIFTRVTPADRLTSLFERVGASVVVCGHTHMQFERVVGTTRVVNAGSVGMPFEGPGAFWLLLDEQIHLRRSVYDFARAAERICATQYPQAAEFAAGNVLRPPSEETMLPLLERAALGRQ